MEETLDVDENYKARVICICILVNYYAVERVAFGYEKPGDKAPIDLYLKHLKLDKYCDSFIRSRIPGLYIDKQERISTEYDYEEYVRTLFVMQMELIFKEEPVDEFLDGEAEDLPFLPSLREYLFGLVPLFTEMMKMPPDSYLVDTLPRIEQIGAPQYKEWSIFVTDILFKRINAGSLLENFPCDNLFLPFYIFMLVEHKDGKCYLKNLDVENYKYIFALFSLMRFMNPDNFKLLELKMFKWEQQNYHDEPLDKSLETILNNLRSKLYGL